MGLQQLLQGYGLPLSDLRYCHNCGRRKTTYEMNCENVGGVDRYCCKPENDADCAKSVGRTFSWYEGWRRSRGLSPYDGVPGKQPYKFVTISADGVEFWYAVHDELYFVVTKWDDQEVTTRFEDRSVLALAYT